MLLLSSRRAMDFGLFIIRLGVGAVFIRHGWPKISGGPEMWAGVGGAMSNIGIDFGHTFFGFLAATAEFGGGIFLILGLLTRPFALAMAFTMLMAFLHHYIKPEDGFGQFSHPLKLMFVFLGLLIAGPGRVSLDEMFFGRFRKSEAGD